MQLREYQTKNDAGESLLTGVRLEKLAEGRRHHFLQKTVDKYVSRDLMTQTDTALTLHTVDGDMVFNIDHPPTRVCLHCGEHLPNEDKAKGGSFIPQGDPRLGMAAREHVAAKHKGKVSPDPQHPSGYKYKNYYGVTPDDSVPTVNPNVRHSVLASVKLGV